MRIFLICLWGDSFFWPSPQQCQALYSSTGPHCCLLGWVEVSWKWGCLAGSQAQILPSAPRPASLDSLALLDHACSAFLPSPPAVRPEVPSDQVWPNAQPAFGYWLNGLYGQEVTRPLVMEEVRLGGGQTAEPSLPVGTSVAWLSFQTGSAGGVHGLLAQVSLCWATVSEWYSVAFHQEHVCLA